MGEPGGLQSMGSHRVGHDWSDLAAAAVATYLKNRVITNQKYTTVSRKPKKKKKKKQKKENIIQKKNHQTKKGKTKKNKEEI